MTSTQPNGLDHILLGAASLEQGMAAFEETTGEKPLRGGHHPNAGTENALVSLGDGSYLEIIAPRAGSPTGDEFLDSMRSLNGLSIVGWAIHVSDAESARRRLERAGFPMTPPKPGSRVTPAGQTLEWVTFEPASSAIENAPFFIRWGDNTAHPSLTSPKGCTLESFEVSGPVERLTSIVNGSIKHLPVRYDTT